MAIKEFRSQGWFWLHLNEILIVIGIFLAYAAAITVPLDVFGVWREVDLIGQSDGLIITPLMFLFTRTAYCGLVTYLTVMTYRYVQSEQPASQSNVDDMREENPVIRMIYSADGFTGGLVGCVASIVLLIAPALIGELLRKVFSLLISF